MFQYHLSLAFFFLLQGNVLVDLIYLYLDSVCFFYILFFDRMFFLVVCSPSEWVILMWYFPGAYYYSFKYVKFIGSFFRMYQQNKKKNSPLSNLLNIMNLMIESKLIPSKIICPYSYVLLTDAVSTSDGYIFSRKAIDTWFEKGQKCNPITHLILPNLQLSEMLQIQKQAKEYEKKGQGLEESLLLLKKQGENQIHFRQELFEFKKNWRKFRESFQKFENQLEIEISTFPSIQLSENMYKGQMKKGYPDGYGLMDYKTGERYLGEWKHGKQEGRGKKFVPHENFYYFGEWKHGVLNGFGCIRPKGEKSLILFKGNFVDGEKSGLGIYEDEEKREKYEGYWKEDKKHGKGVEFYENGDFFQGTWVNDRKTGLGVLKKTTQLGFFVQEWFNDEKEVEVPIMSTISESDKCCEFNPCPFF